METKRVLIVMGSRSDLPSMEGCMKQLDDFQVGYEVRVLSAHRTPEAVLELSKTACERGIQVIIAAAGKAAHLGGVVAGVLASSTPLPVIGIPIQTSALGGLDSLLSTVQMPQGVPVATVAIGKSGARNAAILACQMIGLNDKSLQDKIVAFKNEQAQKVLEQSIVE